MDNMIAEDHQKFRDLMKIFFERGKETYEQGKKNPSLHRQAAYDISYVYGFLSALAQDHQGGKK